MLETFNVLRIDEPDFGCEGRPDGMMQECITMEDANEGEKE